MAERGGYQAPRNPAPVSGPGSLSRRTDGGPGDRQAVRRLPNAKYGESKEFESIQAGAPMRKAPSPEQAAAVPPPVPVKAPSARPDEPVTAGAAAGEGPGEEILGLNYDADRDAASLINALPILEFLASQPNASRQLRILLREVKARI